jgi:hypothetical protein
MLMLSKSHEKADARVAGGWGISVVAVFVVWTLFFVH